MTQQERSSIENGIWLCAKCAKLVDSDEAQYTVELLHKWKKDHEDLTYKWMFTSSFMDNNSIEAVPQNAYSKELIASIGFKTEAINSKDYLKVSSADLLRAGFRKDKIHYLLEKQDIAVQKRNVRLSKFWADYVDTKWDNVPRAWRAVIAGLPIIGQDIESNSLKDLAELVKEFHPYISKNLRLKYLEKARPVLMGIRAEVQSFFQDASSAGGLPIALIDYPPPNWQDLIPWLWGRDRTWNSEDSLIHGYWTYTVDPIVVEKKIKIKNTWSGILFDIVSRLPNPDRQKGVLRNKSDIMTLIYIWCATAPQDFSPSLLKIVRRPVSSSDHTLAGIYKFVKENHDLQYNENNIKT
jgi:hypothetical protein